MLRTKIPPSRVPIPQLLDNRRMAGCGSSDEDPYSIAGSGSSGSSGNGNTRNRSSSRDHPPQLPPRDTAIYGSIPQSSVWAREESQTRKKLQNKEKGDDPYYFGLSARIPNFVKGRKKKQKERDAARARSVPALNPGNPAPSQLPAHPFWWHSRLYDGSQGPGSPSESNGFSRTPTNFVPYDSSDSDYSHIYGRLPIPTRGVRKFPTKPLFLSHWE